MAKVHAAIHGRGTALAALRVAYGDAAHRGRLVVVRGPAGIGRTAVLDAAVAGWTSAGAQVLVATLTADGTDAIDTTDRFGVEPVLRVLRARFEQLGDIRVADSINAVAHLQGLPDKSADWWTLRLAAELDVLFARVAAARRTVLVLDDAQLIQEPTLVLAAARRPGCLVVVSCRDDVAAAPGATELATLADVVIDLRPLSDSDIELAVAGHLGSTVDKSVPAALRTALGPLNGIPGVVMATLAGLRAAGRLVLVRDRLCLRDPLAPIALPADHVLFDRIAELGPTEEALLAAVALLGGLSVDDLPLLASAIGDDLGQCGLAVDRLVELGVLVADATGRVSCQCPALAAAVLDAAGASVELLAGALAAALLDQSRHGQWVDPGLLADLIARAGRALRLTGRDVHWLRETAMAVRLTEPARAARWYAAALKFLIPDETAHTRVLGTVLRLLVRVGDYATLRAVLSDPGVLGVRSEPARTDLRAAALLTAVHTGEPLPADLLARLGGPGAAPGDPLAFAAWWFDPASAPMCGPADAEIFVPAQGNRHGDGTLLSAAEIEVVRVALTGDPVGCGRTWRRLRSAVSSEQIDRLVEAGALGDLATVLGIVLGDERYRVPDTGPLAAYRRLVRAYADADWTQAMATVWELELLGAEGAISRQGARLLAAEICSTRGEFRAAHDWLAPVAGDVRLGALPAWVSVGLRHREEGATGQVVERVRRECARQAEWGARAGLEWLLIRALGIVVLADDVVAATELYGRIEELHRRGSCRGTMEALFLARGMVYADLVYARVGADLTRRGGFRPELLRPLLLLARLADDPQDWLAEAYEVARRCDSGLVREHIRAVSRDRGLSMPRAKARREPFSDTELRIVELISTGHTNRKIASELGISEKTVENHLTRLFARTGCRSRVELAAANIEGRLVDAIAS